MPSLIGNKPNQVPTNGDLGTLAFQDADNVKAGAVIADRLTVDNTTLVVDSTNDRVGIGTSSPATLFHVSSATGSATPTATEVRIATTTSASDWSTTLPWGRLGFYSADSSLSAKTQVALDATADSTTGGSSSLIFSLSDQSTGALTERMRLTSYGAVGIGTSSPARPLEINATGTLGTQLLIQSGSAAGIQLKSGAGKEYEIQSNASSNFILYDRTATATRLTIDTAGNLGLGVTPSAWGSTYRAVQSGNGAAFSGRTNINAAYVSSNFFSNSAGAATYINTDFATLYAQTSGQHIWYNAASGTAGNAITFTQAMTLDASGRLGIGTSSPSEALVVQRTASGAYINSTGQGTSSLWLAGTSGSASVTQFGGELRFNTGGSANTTGTGVTERMRIDSSGNVGIGTSSPSARLQVAGTSGTPQFLAGTSANAISLNVNNSGSIYLTSSVTNSTDFTIGTASSIPFVFFTNNTERMRIDSSGNVGIGTSTLNGAKLFVAQGAAQSPATSGNMTTGMITGSSATGEALNIGTDADGVWYNAAYANNAGVARLHRWLTGGTERMRIDSSGNLLVGKTSSNDNVVGSMIRGTGYFTATWAATDNTITTYHVYSTGATAYRFYVGLGGTIYATSTTISAISDARLKENIQDIDVGLDAVMALKPRKFDWKKGKGKDKKGDRGWIAQEFEQVFPEMIDEWKDPAPEGEEPYKSVNADLIPVLVKAIQEQQAIINELKTRIETLENK